MSKKHYIYRIVALVVTLALGGCLSPEARQAREAESKRWDAAMVSQKFVRDRLKAPSSADFQDFAKAKVQDLGDGIYSVESYVDAQNAFGAKLRSSYICKVRDKGNKQWSLVSMQFLK